MLDLFHTIYVTMDSSPFLLPFILNGALTDHAFLVSSVECEVAFLFSRVDSRVNPWIFFTLSLRDASLLFEDDGEPVFKAGTSSPAESFVISLQILGSASFAISSKSKHWCWRAYEFEKKRSSTNFSNQENQLKTLHAFQYRSIIWPST